MILILISNLLSNVHVLIENGKFERLYRHVQLYKYILLYECVNEIYTTNGKLTKVWLHTIEK